MARAAGRTRAVHGRFQRLNRFALLIARAGPERARFRLRFHVVKNDFVVVVISTITWPFGVGSCKFAGATSTPRSRCFHYEGWRLTQLFFGHRAEGAVADSLFCAAGDRLASLWLA